MNKLNTGKLFRFTTKLYSEEELFLKLAGYLILVICIVRLTNINVLLLTDIPTSFRFVQLLSNATFLCSVAAAAKSLLSCPTLCDPID